MSQSSRAALAALIAGSFFAGGPAKAADSAAALSQVGTVPVAPTPMVAAPAGRPQSAGPANSPQVGTRPARPASTIRTDQQAAESQVIQENRNTNAVTPGQFNNIVLTPIQRGSTVLPSVVGGQAAPPPTGPSPVFGTTP